jgi:hypothetical protein
MHIYPSLMDAINSWYANRVHPQIVVTLKGGSKVSGRLFCSTHEELLVETSGQSDLRAILVTDIEKAGLKWHGINLGMGELDGTGMEGMSLPTSHWEHEIKRSDDGWIFEEVSKEGGMDYQGSRHQ